MSFSSGLCALQEGRAGRGEFRKALAPHKPRSQQPTFSMPKAKDYWHVDYD